MTIVTTDQPQLGFGKGRFGWIVDTITKLGLEFLEEEEPYKYAKLPKPHNGISPRRKTKSKFFANATDTKLQTNYRRRTGKPCRCYKHFSRTVTRSRRLFRTNSRKQRSSYRSSRYERSPFTYFQ